MPWVEPSEPHARPPRVIAPGAPATDLPPWDGVLNLDRGAAELLDVQVARPVEIDLSSCAELSVRDASLTGVSMASGLNMVLDVHRSTLDGCDLSAVRIATIRASRLVGCKLNGTDFAGTTTADVVFERCTFRCGDWRMARFKRVSFVDCVLDEVDAFEGLLEDVDFPGSRLTGVNVDRLDATSVDLREAIEISLQGVGRLNGCLAPSINCRHWPTRWRWPLGSTSSVLRITTIPEAAVSVVSASPEQARHG